MCIIGKAIAKNVPNDKITAKVMFLMYLVAISKCGDIYEMLNQRARRVIFALMMCKFLL